MSTSNQTWIGVEVPINMIHLVGSTDLPHRKYRRRVDEFASPADAKKWQQAAREAVRRGRAPDMTVTSAPDTFGSIAAAAVPHVFADNRDKRGVSIHVRRLVDYFGNMPVDSIRTVDLANMADDLVNHGKSASTIHHALGKFHRIMEWAVDRGLATDPPRYRHKGSGRTRERVFTPAECDDLITRLQGCGQVYAEFATVLLWTGGRYTETAQLTWADVDRADNFVRFRGSTTKSGKPRTIPLRTPAVAALESAWVDRGHEHGPFVMLRKHNSFYTPWNNVRHDMGMADDDDFVPHSLRHTCMTRLAEGGMSLPQLKAWGGWASYNMVARYEHLETGHGLQKAIDSNPSLNI